MLVKVRRQGAVSSTTVLLAVGVTSEGQREILGLEVAFAETDAAWGRLLKQLKERSLSGVEVATSDAHEGLRQALAERFPGVTWQRCQAHFRRNVADHTPATLKDEMHEALDGILGATSPEKARTACNEAAAQLDGRADAALRVLGEGFEDATAVLALPAKYRRRLRTSNMLERFIEEIRRRENIIRIFPNTESVWRLVGALCAEQHEEWSTGRRYLTMDEFYRWKASAHDEDPSLPIAA